MSPEMTLLCYFVAFVLFILAAAKVPERWVNYIGAGLAFALLPTLWAAIQAV